MPKQALESLTESMFYLLMALTQGERCGTEITAFAAEITAAAQSESRTLRQTVTDYCDNMLKTTEEAMVENAAQVKNVRANLRQNAKKNG